MGLMDYFTTIIGLGRDIRASISRIWTNQDSLESSWCQISVQSNRLLPLA
jgi:hypothetical protein